MGAVVGAAVGATVGVKIYMGAIVGNKDSTPCWVGVCPAEVLSDLLYTCPLTLASLSVLLR